MKRIVVLIDGTWDKQGTGADTNVAKLDSANKTISQAFIKAQATDGAVQNAHYHDGVGAERNLLVRGLGLIFGWGLKKIIQDAYGFVVADYVVGDEIYICGFSRGAYAARALAGLIGASGIQRREGPGTFEVAWNHYRLKPSVRQQPQTANSADQETITDYKLLAQRQAFHDARSIKCVAVWDTVGAYGIPVGVGFTALARYVALLFLGFHDTSFGDHIDVGLHAVAVDENRRPFVPTFWTIPKGQQPRGHVEQTWFAGAHENVGGGYADSSLSDLALIWMIARIQALTGLEFNVEAVRASTNSNVRGAVMDSAAGIWILDHYYPYYRPVLSPVAIHHGYLRNTNDPNEEHINERVHWSAVAKRDSRTVPAYNPRNLPAAIAAQSIAAITDEERKFLGEGTSSVSN